MSEEETHSQSVSESMNDIIETPRQALCRQLKERVARGEYWVDLDFLASLLVDSGAARTLGKDE